MRAGIKPETVVAAAADIADRDGWDRISLAGVAGALGIRTPSLYNHVEGLPDLRQKLASHALALLDERLHDAAIGYSGRQAFVEVGRSYVQFVREHPGLYEAVNRVVSPKPDAFEQASDRILTLFARLMQPLGVPENEAVHAIRGLRAMVHGFASLESVGGFQMKQDLMESLSKSITYYIDGLSAGHK
ncbi:TetR-like C-terminal domain-containing protein [Cohnella cellulosilytica]|uniref:TetR-like C-terminal domain-containing protein n=1 Tax=Cohnella cellulosilytica TaxID=986710 RepID=A0ABW2FBY1_9BACL